MDCAQSLNDWLIDWMCFEWNQSWNLHSVKSCLALILVCYLLLNEYLRRGRFCKLFLAALDVLQMKTYIAITPGLFLFFSNIIVPTIQSLPWKKVFLSIVVLAVFGCASQMKLILTLAITLAQLILLLLFWSKITKPAGTTTS